MIRRALTVLALVSVIACGGSTGGARIHFPAAASGPVNATGSTLIFNNGLGYQVSLSRARLHIGAVYLNQTVPSSGSQETGCFLPGIYVAQVLGSLDVDALSPLPQPFPVEGEATDLTAHAGELWLTGGAIDAIDDLTVILDVAGTADLGGNTFPFEGQLTIGRSRLIPSTDPAFPSAHSICKQRIVSPIPVQLTALPTGGLLVRVDPRGWFAAVDFSALTKVSDVPLLYRFNDAPVTPPDVSLFNGLRSRTGAYHFSWQ